MEMSLTHLRFAVGSPTGARSSIWWAAAEGPGDFYVGRRGIPSVKASLHATGEWQIEFTREAIEKGKAQPTVSAYPGQQARGRTRFIDKWTRPPERAPGLTKALLVRVPSSAVVPRAEGFLKKTHWTEAPAGRTVEYLLVLTPFSLWEMRGPEDVTHVGTIGADGAPEKLWVLSRQVDDREWLPRIETNYPQLEALATGINRDGTRLLIDRVPSTSPPR